MAWSKDVVSWKLDGTLYLSIPFTWLVPQARKLARTYHGKVIAGGPGAYLRKDEVQKWADVKHNLTFTRPLEFHNPLATFTTRGCPNDCSFCAVPKIEGDFKELENYVPRPYVCDNNFLAASRTHIQKVINSLQCMPFVDFNQGLDVRLLKKWHLAEIAKLKKVHLRFAFDHVNLEKTVHEAVKKSEKKGFKDISIYVLIGFNDTPEEAKYKLDKVIEWGARPVPMRYQPLDCIEKNSYVGSNWTARELSRMVRYYFRQNWLSKVPYEEYRPPKNPSLERLL